MKRILMALTVIAALAGSAHRAAAQAYVVVANANNGVAELTKRDLSAAFLKKSSKLVPVDLAKDSPVRAAFSQQVHGRSASAIASYWQQQIFAGREVPPVEKSDDAQVLAYVRANPNAIGYVSASASIGDGVKVVAVK